MNTEAMLLLLGAAGVAWFVMRSRQGAPSYPGIPAEGATPRRRQHPNGAKVTARGFAGQDWSRWMEIAPQAFEYVLHEGVEDPEEIVNNAFRRLYPRHRWPPTPGDQRYATWREMVHSVAATLERPHAPGMHVVQ